MILSLYDSIDIQCVKIRLLYYGITLYQKSSGSNPDSETKKGEKFIPSFHYEKTGSPDGTTKQPLSRLFCCKRLKRGIYAGS